MITFPIMARPRLATRAPTSAPPTLRVASSGRAWWKRVCHVQKVAILSEMARLPKKYTFEVTGWVGDCWLATTADLKRLVPKEPEPRHSIRWKLVADVATDVLRAARDGDSTRTASARRSHDHRCGRGLPRSIRRVHRCPGVARRLVPAAEPRRPRPRLRCLSQQLRRLRRQSG
jgi:hypothetical protein